MYSLDKLGRLINPEILRVINPPSDLVSLQ